MNALPPKLLALLTGLLLLEASPTLAAPQVSPLPSTEPVRLSQRLSRSRFPSRFRPQPRIPQRVTRPRRTLVPARSPRFRVLPRPSNRLSWSPSGRPLRAPSYRWGGLARGSADCKANNITATALLPKSRRPRPDDNDPGSTANATTLDATNNPSNELSNFDVTLQSHPTFWIHVADLPPTIAEFTIQNIEGTQQLYDAQFRIDGGTGLVGITMPDSAPALETNQAYIWRVRLECNPDDPSKDFYLGNEIKHITDSNLNQINERDRPAYYANKGIWQDAISALALLRFDAPNDVVIKEEWQILLDEDDLEMSEFKASPILQIF